MVRDVFRERLSLISTADKGLIFYLLDDLILLHSDSMIHNTTVINQAETEIILYFVDITKYNIRPLSKLLPR